MTAERAHADDASPAPVAAVPQHPLLRRGADLAPTGHVLPTGLAPFDAEHGGLALRRTHLLTGTRGAGCMSLLHAMLAAITRTHPVLLIDPLARFHPAAAAAAGVHLPHLPWMRTTAPHHTRQVLGFALHGDAFPLIVWDGGAAPPAALLDRLRPVVRCSASALLIVADDAPLPGPVADGVTLRVAHDAWSHATGALRGCDGRALTIHATDHRRGRSWSFPLHIPFRSPLPSLIPFAQRGGLPDASTARGGALDTGAGPTVRRAG